MTPKEAADILGLEYTTILHHLKKTGLLTGQQDDRGRWQVDPESVKAFQRIERPAGRTGRRPNLESARDATRRSLYLGTEISPDDVARIRRLLPARLRAAVLLRLANYAEGEPESFKRALKSLGVQL
jgi:hypothetical protein